MNLEVEQLDVKMTFLHRDLDEIIYMEVLKSRGILKISSIKVVLVLAVSMNLDAKQLDVKTVFLHGDLKKTIYMEQLESIEVKKKKHMIYKLKKNLYGLKQALRQ